MEATAVERREIPSSYRDDIEKGIAKSVRKYSVSLSTAPSVAYVWCDKLQQMAGKHSMEWLKKYTPNWWRKFIS